MMVTDRGIELNTGMTDWSQEKADSCAAFIAKHPVREGGLSGPRHGAAEDSAPVSTPTAKRRPARILAT